MNLQEIINELLDKHLEKPSGKTNKKAKKEDNELASFNADCVRLFEKWLLRGDGVAVYENQDLGSALVGHKKFCSFGSPAAQIELDEPPQKMPDIGAIVNWRYQLVATYKLEELEEDGAIHNQ